MSTNQTPSICIVVSGASAPSFGNQTVRDYQVLRNVDEATALRRSAAACFLWLSGAAPLRPQAAEECVWALQTAEWVTWRDTGEAPPPSLRHCAGPLGVTRRTLETPEAKRSGEVRRLPWSCRLNRVPATAGTSSGGEPAAAEPAWRAPPSRRSEAAPRNRLVACLAQAALHLRNAGWFSQRSWTSDPLGTAARLIPLSFKQRINAWAARPFFDLTFYLQFRPGSALIDGKIVGRVYYETPPPAGRRRVCLFTGPLQNRSAPLALFELARQLGRETHELFLVTTGETEVAFRRECLEIVDYHYGAQELAGPELISSFLYSFLLNWNIDVLVIQGEPRAYRVLRPVKNSYPRLRVVDFAPSVDHDWDAFSLSLEADEYLDWRIASSTGEQARLREMAVEEKKIRVIPPGVDVGAMSREHHGAEEAAGNPKRRKLALSPRAPLVVYSGTLRNNSQIALLTDVAEQLAQLRPRADFHILAAAAGPAQKRLQMEISKRGLKGQVSILASSRELPQALAAASLFVTAFPQATLPLEVLQALAARLPVVGCKGGAVEDAIPPSCALLVEGGTLLETRLAAAIHSLLTDPARLQQMGRSGHAFVEQKHSLEQTRRRYKKLIAEWTR